MIYIYIYKILFYFLMIVVVMIIIFFNVTLLLMYLDFCANLVGKFHGKKVFILNLMLAANNVNN